ncbi:Rne/Rng family ribonuclease [Agreia sp. COWG]|uniref:Rne/Rng family ribonuclease n=1 Tax=Agreia sp. COWG TaxID=2773266 RepID=UPI001928EF22|nr:Rne/Rng family ribonuclease [Agreia sp. COWG]CAD5996324.1 Ribonuclease G [Agreia sp. COWG]
MVEDNNNTGSSNTESAPRKRLFGGRKTSRRVTDASPQQPAVPPVSERAEAAAPAQVPAETPDAMAAPAASGFDTEHPGLAPLEPSTQAPATQSKAPLRPTTSLFFQAPDIQPLPPRDDDDAADDDDRPDTSVRRRSRRRSGEDNRPGDNDPANTVVKVRAPRPEPELITEPQRIKGSTRLEAKKQRRRDGRDAGRRRPVVTEAEFLARRESVDRVMVIRAKDNKIQIGVLEDGVLVEHYVAKAQDASLIGNVYLGKVQNVLPSMEAAFVDIGRGRNAVLYAGEVDWDAAAAESPNGGNQARKIELALKPGATVLVQVTKDPVGHKGARLTSQISLPGRYLVYVPNGSMNGISRKLPDTERARLKKILKEVLPENVGVIVRTASEGATEEQLTLDVSRLTKQWSEISTAVQKQQSPALLHSEPDLLIKIVRDVFNEDFQRLVISGDDARSTIETYLAQVAPDLLDRVERYEGERDAFEEFRVSEQIEKALDRKVWLPSGGSLVIDRTEAMTVVDVNTGKFVGSGGNLEETVTKNNLEAAEEIVRQLRLRDIGGIIVVDFIDMVLETNRDLVLRRMVECLSRDRTKHQVAEVTSLGLVQMTRKKLGLGLLESFSEACEVCAGRGVIVHHDPVVKHRGQTGAPALGGAPQQERRRSGRGGNGNGGGNNGSNGNGNGNGSNGSAQGNGGGSQATQGVSAPRPHSITDDAKNALAKIAASTIATHTGAVNIITAEQSEAAKAQPETSPRAEAPAASASEVAAQPDADTAQAGSTASGSGSSRSRKGNRRSRQARSEAPDADDASDSPVETQAPVAEAPTEEPVVITLPVQATVDILDIPVAKAPASQRRISNRDAEVLLDSVLDALPEPKQPGQGRSRSRRVSTAALSAPTPEQE